LLATFTTLLDDLTAGARLMAALPVFLRQPIRADAARQVLAARRARRADDFLRFTREVVWERPGGPYGQLFRQAGCEYGDLARLVTLEGIEAALARLYRAGIYLSVDELKGCKPAVRGSATIQFGLRRMRNPRGSVQVRTWSSGSWGPSTEAVVDLADYRAHTHNLSVAVG
jgi:hypothetical protein